MKGIEMVEKRWTDCVAFEGDYVDENLSQENLKNIHGYPRYV